MASTRASSDGEEEEDNGDPTFSPKKVGRAAEYPEFAIIWSFLENFCEFLRFPDLSLDNLEDAFNSHSHRNENFRELEFLHRKLLSRLHKSFKPNKWEQILLKVAKEYNVPCSWDLENFGYDELKISSKLELFKMCLEGQFDNHSKLKDNVNKNYEADDLRLKPFGRDVEGLIYWLHTDEHGGVRLYSTEEDEVESESWKLLASELDELEDVIGCLELKCVTNPKELALAKREEEKKELEKQGKNKKKGKKASKLDEELDDDNPCARCFSNVHPDSILLCDKCDAAYHTACLRPPLMTIPQGDWFCPFCQQLVLLERLKEKRSRLVQRQRLRARQAKRLCKHGMNLSNILQGPGSDEEPMEAQTRRSGRSRKTVDYTFKEFDDEIQDAVERDKKQLKMDEEMNGHPTGKPAFAVEKFYGPVAACSTRNGKRRSRRLQDLDSVSDSGSKTSEYEYDASSDDEPKRPERHVYLRRHYRIEDDDEDEDGEENQSGKENEEVNESDGDKEREDHCKDDEGTRTTEDKIGDKNGNSDEHSVKNSGRETATDSGDDAGSDKSGYANEHLDKNHEPSQEPVNSSVSTKSQKPVATVSSNAAKTVAPVGAVSTNVGNNVPPLVAVTSVVENVPRVSKVSPLSSPKIDPLLDSLGFGALGSSFDEKYGNSAISPSSYGAFSPTSPSRRLPPRPDAFRGSFSPTATSPDGRFPTRPEPMGYSPSSNMGAPSSPLPRASSDGRYGAFPTYNHSSQYGNYFNYNQTEFSGTAAVSGGFAGSQPQRPPSYSQAMSSRQFPGYNQISNRETSAFSQTPQSPSYNQTGPVVPGSPFAVSSFGGFPPSYRGTDSTGSRTGYYPSGNSSYMYPQSVPQPPYMPDDPFGAITGYGSQGLAQRGGSSVGQGRSSSWSSSQGTGAGMYFPQQSSMGSTAGQQGHS